MAPFVLGYRDRFKRCEVTQGESRKVNEALSKLPAAMAGELTNLNFQSLSGLRQRNVYRLKVPPFRVVYQVFGRQILVLELDRRDDHTYKHLDRLIFRRIGEGIDVVEVAERQEATPRVPSARAQVHHAAPVTHQNPLTSFATKDLAAMGADDITIGLVRQMRETIDLAAVLAERGGDPEVIELLADAWHDPQRYHEIFDSGRVPTVRDARLADEEIEQRLAAGAAGVAPIDERDLEQILTGTIDQWMFYLHPLQTRVAQHQPTGPSRVRGGPGSGKTVAALHRAKFLVRERHAERVLLTTFVKVLPATWRRLLVEFAPAEAGAITTRTVDSLAVGIVAGVDGDPTILTRPEDLQPLAERAIEHVGLTGRSPQWLLTEFDAVIAGRGLTQETWLAGVPRPGRGSAVSPAERPSIWAAYEHYRAALAKQSATDFAHLRVRALELALEGHGERFDGIVVDEAQDLTETQVRLLCALDNDPDHKCVMLVGDGQQSVYPGGFSLRSAGLDVRGRSFVLRTNWRNTQRIADAAVLVLGDQNVRDLESDQVIERDDSPPRRLGDLPQLHLTSAAVSVNDVLTEVMGEALKWCAPDEIAIVARKNKQAEGAADHVRKELGLVTVRLTDLPKKDDGAPGAVRIGTFEYSKGMEFKVVVLVGAKRGDWTVNPFWLKAKDDQVDWWRGERRRLFVAMTRARDQLTLIASEPLSKLVEDAREMFDVWTW